jgi:transposase InsO family protein
VPDTNCGGYSGLTTSSRGKPQQNAYIERYNWLSHCLFESIGEVQNYATQWMKTYNHERPNMALSGINPKQKLAFLTNSTRQAEIVLLVKLHCYDHILQHHAH